MKVTFVERLRPTRRDSKGSCHRLSPSAPKMQRSLPTAQAHIGDVQSGDGYVPIGASNTSLTMAERRAVGNRFGFKCRSRFVDALHRSVIPMKHFCIILTKASSFANVNSCREV
jgi:hypothetical protein